MKILTQYWITFFLFATQFINAFKFSGLNIASNAVICTRNELTASGIQVAGGKDWKEHGYTSRNLSEFFYNLPPSVYEDILVRFPYKYSVYKLPFTVNRIY